MLIFDNFETFYSKVNDFDIFASEDCNIPGIRISDVSQLTINKCTHAFEMHFLQLILSNIKFYDSNWKVSNEPRSFVTNRQAIIRISEKNQRIKDFQLNNGT